MYTSGLNLPKKSLKVKKQKNDEKPNSKNDLKTQISMANFSIEDDDESGSPIGIPFSWESQPGTPKINNFKENITLPPLTPPPSYFYKTKAKIPSKTLHSKSNNLFSNKFSRKSRLPASPASSSSQFSRRISYSVPSSPINIAVPRSSGSAGYGISASPRKSLESSRMMVDEEEHECDSPVSTICFGIGRGGNGRSHGCYASMVKLLIA